MENNLKNLPKFYPGQKVSYDDSISGHVDCDYTINDGCVLTVKSQFFHASNGRDNFWEVNEYPGYVFNEKCLIPIQESPFPSLTFKEVIEKEKVLTCNN